MKHFHLGINEQFHDTDIILSSHGKTPSGHGANDTARRHFFQGAEHPQFSNGVVILMGVWHTGIHLESCITIGIGPDEIADLRNPIMCRTHESTDTDIIDMIEDIHNSTGILEAHGLRSRLLIRHVVDGKKRELVSRFKLGKKPKEIRLSISTKSIAGYSALKQVPINIKNVYDDEELTSIDPDLKFDKIWDQEVGFVSKQVLVVPIIFKKFLLGAIQLINRKDGDSFTKVDEQSLAEMAKILGIVLYNQKRMVKTQPGKFDYLLENHFLTQKELQKTVTDARIRKQPVEAVLISDYKISKQEIGNALSKYYRVPFVEYNANARTPLELVTGLNVPFLFNNIWVPLRREGEKIVIAIDNPYDLQKIEVIKSLFAGKAIELNVALEEDIFKFIKLFTRVEKDGP